MQLVEAIKAKRLAGAAGKHGFWDATKANASFWRFFDDIMETKNKASGKSNC